MKLIIIIPIQDNSVGSFAIMVIILHASLIHSGVIALRASFTPWHS